MISPLEIRQHSFGKALRGYDTEEVKAFLGSLSQEWERLQEENKRLRQELDRAQASLSTFKEMEGMLHKTLLQAEQTSKAATEQAQREASLQLAEARQQAQALLASANEERAATEAATQELGRRRSEMLDQMRAFLESHLQRLTAFERYEAAPTPPRANGASPSFYERALTGPHTSSSVSQPAAQAPAPDLA